MPEKTDMTPEKTDMMKARAAPVLKCRNVGRATAFYCNALGASVNWTHRGGSGGGSGGGESDPGYVSLTLFGGEAHLSSFAGDGAYGSAVYFYVDDVDALAERVGATAPDAIDDGPVDRPWGLRELYLRDPDNNALRFGAEMEKTGFGAEMEKMPR